MEESILTFKDYNISGNLLRAYFDSDNKLVFVLDNTIDDIKSNVLLVINPVGSRKWDDILQNDYGMDLETVRPKKDNKYQKLDIEYDGLGEYEALISAYESGNDLENALNNVLVFREKSVKHAAEERLVIAEANAEKARETIEKTKASIAELQEKLRQLRSKLSQQKKQVGREPTKKSASKILRTDAQIDATNEKLHRAKKRLDNAQRRLIVADEDAEQARDIIASSKTVEREENTELAMPLPTSVVPTTVMGARSNAADGFVDAEAPEQLEEYEESTNFVENTDIQKEQKAENMAEEEKKEEVKPLFDTDPEILDEEIAFKPIEFGVSSPTPESSSSSVSSNMYENVVEDKPLSFVPPDAGGNRNAGTDNSTAAAPYSASDSNTMTSPVLDTIKSVDLPSQNNFVNQQMPSEPMAQQPQVNSAAQQSPVARPVPPAATVSGAAAARPVSPITGNAEPTSPAPRKPTLIYYVMLILLIGLSIFTLWLYQKNSAEKAPDLTQTEPVEEVVAEPTSTEPELDSPFLPVIEPEPVAVEPEPEPIPVPVPVAEPEPVQEAVTEEVQAEQMVEQPVATPEPAPVIEEPEVPAQTADVVIENIGMFASAPVIEPEPVSIPTEEEVLASKPSYSVSSQNENMFIASPEYDTETVYSGAAEETVNLPTCPDGTAPDVNGCCTGEIFTDMGDMGFNCCPETGGDCFPPLF